MGAAPSEGLSKTLSNIDKIFSNAQDSLSSPKSASFSTSISAPSALSAFSDDTRHDFQMNMGMDKMEKASDSLHELMKKIKGSSFLQQEENDDEPHFTAHQMQTETGRTVFVYTKVGEPEPEAPSDAVQVNALIDA